MLTLKIDNQIAMTTPSEKRDETPYLRATVVETEPGFEAMQSSRVRIFGDTNPELLAKKGEWIRVGADITDRTKDEVTGKVTFTLDNVRVKHVLTAKESAPLEAAYNMAQLAQLLAVEPRVVARKGALAAAGDKPVATAPELVAAGDDL
jgi:hypothetical protein